MISFGKYFFHDIFELISIFGFLNKHYEIGIIKQLFLRLKFAYSTPGVPLSWKTQAC